MSFVGGDEEDCDVSTLVSGRVDDKTAGFRLSIKTAC